MLDRIGQPVPVSPPASRQAVGKLLIALVEKSAGVIPADGYSDDAPYYLRQDEDTLLRAFGDAIDIAISEVNQIRCAAERALEILCSTPEGSHDVDTLRIVAIERFRDERCASIKGHSDDDRFPASGLAIP